MMIEYIINFLVFPGFAFTLGAGMLASWIDRKVTARIQWRVGPPIYQPLVDIIKLLGKETLIPQGVKRVGFLVAPIVGLIGVTLASLILWSANLYQKGFMGDRTMTEATGTRAAVQRAKMIAGSVAVRFAGESHVVSQAEVDRMVEDGQSFAYLYEHEGRIVTIPVN